MEPWLYCLRDVDSPVPLFSFKTCKKYIYIYIIASAYVNFGNVLLIFETKLL